MAINLLTFYQRIGKLAEAAVHANTYRGTTLPADVVDIASVYTGAPSLLDNLYAVEDNQQASVGYLNSALQSLAISTLYNSVNADRILTDQSQSAYLTELNRQQIEQSIELDDSPATIGTTKQVGAYTFTRSITTASASATVTMGTGLTTAPVRVGMLVVATGIPVGARVDTIYSDTVFDITAAATASATVTGTFTGNRGDSTIVIFNKDIHGVTLDTVFPETLRFDVSADVERGATKWQEGVLITGEANESDKLTWTWPDGSGTSFAVNISDPADSNGIVTNGTFNTWTSPTVLASWEAVAGTVVTDFDHDGDVPRPGDQTYCLRMVAGGTSVNLRQPIDLQPSTKYAITFLYKSDTGASEDISVSVTDGGFTLSCTTDSTSTVTAATATLSAGMSVTGSGVPLGAVIAEILNGSSFKLSVSTTASATVDLVFDGTGGAITDDAGTPITLTVGADTSDGVWTLATVAFVTPAILPDETWIGLTWVSGASSGDVRISNLQIVPLVDLYSGGPATAIISGVVPNKFDDRSTVAITVSGVDGSVVRWMDRFLDVTRYGVSLRTGTSATAGYADGTLIS